eukprot:g68990.t1
MPPKPRGQQTITAAFKRHTRRTASTGKDKGGKTKKRKKEELQEEWEDLEYFTGETKRKVKEQDRKVTRITIETSPLKQERHSAHVKDAEQRKKKKEEELEAEPKGENEGEKEEVVVVEEEEEEVEEEEEEERDEEQAIELEGSLEDDLVFPKVDRSQMLAGIWDDLSDKEILLRRFDMDMAFGPCLNITRTQRWLAAEKLGLNPPQHIRAILSHERKKARYQLKVVAVQGDHNHSHNHKHNHNHTAGGKGQAGGVGQVDFEHNVADWSRSPHLQLENA